MFNFFKKLKGITFAALLAGGLALIITTIFSGLLFDVEAPVVFGWFCTILVAFFVLVLAIALVCFIVWFVCPNIFVLAGALAALLLAAFVFIAKIGPVYDFGELLAPAVDFLTEQFNSFLAK